MQPSLFWSNMVAFGDIELFSFQWLIFLGCNDNDRKKVMESSPRTLCRNSAAVLVGICLNIVIFIRDVLESMDIFLQLNTCFNMFSYMIPFLYERILPKPAGVHEIDPRRVERYEETCSSGCNFARGPRPTCCCGCRKPGFPASCSFVAFLDIFMNQTEVQKHSSRRFRNPGFCMIGLYCPARGSTLFFSVCFLMTMDLTVFLCEVSACWGNRGDLPAERTGNPAVVFTAEAVAKTGTAVPHVRND